MRVRMSGVIGRNARLFLVGAGLCSLLLMDISLVSAAPPLRAADACAVTPGSGAYPTINAATTDVNCASVTVPAGTFAEQITINHSLTLTGAGTGKTVVTYPSSPVSTGSTFTLVTIGAGGTTISGLTVNGQNYQCPASCIGFLINQGGVTINGVSAVNIIGAIASSANSSNGQRVTVQNSYFGGTVTAGPFGAPFYFQSNTVVGNGSSLQTGLLGGTYVSGNTFKHFHSSSCTGCVPGASQGSAIATGAGTIANNTFLDSDTGILVEQAENTVTISGNTFSGVGTAIVLALNQTKQVVQNNHISNVVRGGGWPYYPGVAIAVCGERGDTIKGNTISGAAVYGIAMFAYQSAGCFNSGPGSYPTTNNSVSGNTVSGSGSADLYDSTHGSGLAGTANLYSGNTCKVGQPTGLCPSTAASATGTSASGSPTPLSTEDASATATAVAGAGVAGGVQTGPGGGQGSSSGSLILVIVFAVLGLLLVISGGALAYVLIRRRRLAAAAFPDMYDDGYGYDQRGGYDQHGGYGPPDNYGQRGDYRQRTDYGPRYDDQTYDDGW
jgi:hypothetical protein